MKKVFISQPMRGLSDDAILAERKEATEKIKELYGDNEVEIIDSFVEGAPHEAKPLWFLGESLKKLADADVAYFCDGFSEARGCMLEYHAAQSYCIDTVCANPDEEYPEGELVTEELSFGDALASCKLGGKIARSGWNGKGMFVVYQKGYPEGIPCNLNGDNFVCNPYLQIKNTDGSYSMWVPSIGDVLANDWYIL